MSAAVLAKMCCLYSGVRPGLVAGHKPGPQADPLSPRPQRAGYSGAVADPARGQHRHRANRVHHLRQQFPDRGGAPDVPACLHPLGDDPVGAAAAAARASAAESTWTTTSAPDRCATWM